MSLLPSTITSFNNVFLDASRFDETSTVVEEITFTTSASISESFEISGFINLTFCPI